MAQSPAVMAAEILPPAQAAAVLVVPSLVTNVWQLAAGPAFGALIRRLWSMMAGVVGGTLAGAGVLDELRSDSSVFMIPAWVFDTNQFSCV